MDWHPGILLVEDEVLIVQFITQALRNMGFMVKSSLAIGEDVNSHVEKHRPDLVLMDINLAGEMSGIEAARLLKERFDIPLIFITGYSEIDIREEALALKPAGILVKPILLKDLRTAVLSVLADPRGIDAHQALGGL